MADTSNHEYNVPEQGDEDWHQPLNENFEAFEVDIELRDDEANLGDYTPTAGAKFLATDTGVVYLGDGSSWVAAFVHPAYDDAADEAQFAQTVSIPGLTGPLTGGQELTDLAGNNLSIDGNGQLNASTGGSGGGISTLSGGEGIDPANIGDSDTLSVAWGDANDLDSDGNVTGGGGGGGISSLSGGEGIDPSSIGDGDTLSVASGDLAGGGLGTDGNNNLTLAAGGVGTAELATPFADLATLVGDPVVTGADLQSSGAMTFETNGGDRTLELGVPGTGLGGSEAGGNVVAGHPNNTVNNDAVGAVIGGGGANNGAENTVGGDYAAVHGGIENTASREYATVDGGANNTASGGNATVGGGENNTASGINATVSGGNLNTATARATVPGGSKGAAEDPRSFVWNDGSEYHAIPNAFTDGLSSSTAVDGEPVTGSETFSASATNGFRFITGSSSVTYIDSDGNLTLGGSTIQPSSGEPLEIDASAGTGVGTDSPVTTFHVKDEVAESGGDNLGRHVAAVENTSDSGSPIPDVLGLELSNVTDPGQFHSYISFMDSTGTIGNIQGDGSGSVEFTGSTADFAEYFPKADPDREFVDGEVVGLQDGEVVDLAGDADPDAVLAVSTAPLVTGNRPIDEDERDGYVKLTLVGQVPVRVSEAVSHGDVLVASPDGDGTAVARADCPEEGRPVVGMALADSEAGEAVRTLVGGPGIDSKPAPGATLPETVGADSASDDTQASDSTAQGEDSAGQADRIQELQTQLDEKDERIADLEADRDELRAENERLRTRLAAVEDHLGLDSTADPVPADD